MPHRLSYWVPVHITKDEFVILSAALTQHGTAEAKALLETLIASRRPLLEYCPEGTRPPLPNRNEPLEDLPYEQANRRPPTYAPGQEAAPMDFKPMHSTGAWYRAHGSFEHPQVGTIGWTAAIHESDLDSLRGRWRPSVEFTSTFSATLSVRTPDYGTYADLTAAKAWCQAVVTQRHFATLLRQTTEEVADLTRIFNSKHPENPE